MDIKNLRSVFGRGYWSAVLSVAILSFGFTLTNYSIGVDDPAMGMYYQGKVLLSQGRFGVELIRPFVDITGFLPGWLDVLAVFLLLAAGIVWSFFFYMMSERNISSAALAVFSCFLISFPFIGNIFIFMPAVILNSFNLLFAGLACVSFYEAIVSDERKKLFLYLFTASLLTAIGMGFYESSVIYLASGAMMGLFLSEVRKREASRFAEVIKNVLYVFLIIIASIVLNRIFLNVILAINNMTSSNYAFNYFSYDKTSNIFVQALQVIAKFHQYVITAAQSESVYRNFLAGMVIVAVAAIIAFIRKKNPLAIILGGGVLSSRRKA